MDAPPPRRALHGVVVLDKPKGPTSHDVVAGVRRALGTRAVGHAGTLDPMATGVLVVAIGEATKLVAYLTSQEKRYEAAVTFGCATTTLDGMGDVVRREPVRAELALELRALAAGAAAGPLVTEALRRELVRSAQVPPAFSAVKQAGERAHARARRGEQVELPPRAVEVRELEIIGASEDTLNVSITAAKGYYVRSFARDLGETLGTPAHLSSLRRVASGPFTLEETVPAGAARERLVDALEPLARAAARVLDVSRLSAGGTALARQGRTLGPEHFIAPPEGDRSAWIDDAGELVAIGERRPDGKFAVARGFVHSTSMAVG